MTNVPHLLAIGLPEAGKTTFLAALWHVSESEEVSGSLRLERISENAKHLNSIKNDWLCLRQVGRTIPGQEQSTVLSLRDEQIGSIGEVIFPDLSGESFEGAWKDRRWTKEYDDLFSGAGSLLLFIHPNKVREPYTIAEMRKMTESAFPEGVDLAENGIQIERKPVEGDLGGAMHSSVDKWAPEKAPTQVQLVELLQFSIRRMHAKQPVHVGIIISAWDLVKRVRPDLDARNWLAERLPYLDQFLRSNFEQFRFRVYGVSAQGGDLKIDREHLQHCKCASDRILIEGSECVLHDISEPVRWAIGLRNGME